MRAKSELQTAVQEEGSFQQMTRLRGTMGPGGLLGGLSQATSVTSSDGFVDGSSYSENKEAPAVALWGACDLFQLFACIETNLPKNFCC